MIDTEKTAKGKQFFFDKQKDVPTKKKLEARWQTVNGKLVCRWVEVETQVKPALVIDNSDI